MINNYDVVIIGAGVLGCFCARSLSQLEVSCAVLEQREDVCLEMTKSNSGIIYPGYDHDPDNLKTKLCIEGNRNFESLCRELDVPYRKCGLLMVGYGSHGNEEISKKYKKGRKNGLEGLSILSGEEAERLEPNLRKGISLAMLAENTYTVNPWSLGIAAYENARDNGVEFRFAVKAEAVRRDDGGFVVETNGGTYAAKAVINCAGSRADILRNTSEGDPLVRVFPSGGTYFVMDTTQGSLVSHIINCKGAEKGNDLTIIPTVDGNLLLGPSSQEESDCCSYPTEEYSIGTLREACSTFIPAMDISGVIRSFGTIKPKPFQLEKVDGAFIRGEKAISDFVILEENGLISLIAIKKPGLSCAKELGDYVASKVSAHLGITERKRNFNPIRKASPRPKLMNEQERADFIRNNPLYGDIVCRCNTISRGEVLDAIRSGAVTVDGIKRRTGAGMGRCQGGYCLQHVIEAVASEKGTSPSSVNKDFPGSEPIRGII